MTENFADADAELAAERVPGKSRQLPDDAKPAADAAPNLAPAVDAATLAADPGATPRD